MTKTMSLEEIITLALQLPPGERLRLVERVVASVGREIENNPSPSDEHWGKHLVQMVEELDFNNWTDIDEDDPVEWVKHARENQAKRRNLDWGSDE